MTDSVPTISARKFDKVGTRMSLKLANFERDVVFEKAGLQSRPAILAHHFVWLMQHLRKIEPEESASTETVIS